MLYTPVVIVGCYTMELTLQRMSLNLVDHTGAAMIAPMVNPFDPGMTKEEKLGTWDKWTRRRKLMYYSARRFPRFLRFFYRRTFLSGKHGPIDKWLSLSLAEQVSSFNLKSYSLHPKIIVQEQKTLTLRYLHIMRLLINR